MLKDSEAKKCILQTCRIAKTHLHNSRFCHQNYCELLDDENDNAFGQVTSDNDNDNDNGDEDYN